MVVSGLAVTSFGGSDITGSWVHRQLVGTNWWWCDTSVGCHGLFLTVVLVVVVKSVYTMMPWSDGDVSYSSWPLFDLSSHVRITTHECFTILEANFTKRFLITLIIISLLMLRELQKDSGAHHEGRKWAGNTKPKRKWLGIHIFLNLGRWATWRHRRLFPQTSTRREGGRSRWMKREICSTAIGALR